MSNQKGDGNIITIVVILSAVLGLLVVFNAVTSVQDYNRKHPVKEVVRASD